MDFRKVRKLNDNSDARILRAEWKRDNTYTRLIVRDEVVPPLTVIHLRYLFCFRGDGVEEGGFNRPVLLRCLGTNEISIQIRPSSICNKQFFTERYDGAFTVMAVSVQISFSPPSRFA